jgi:uncharacterized protein
MKLPLVVSAPLLAAVPAAGQAPLPDLAAEGTVPTIREVSFASAGITLSGTLLALLKPVAAVVLVHGSGREARMLGLARWLAAHGVAALTYDKRGVYAGPEVGTINVTPENLDLLAGDAAAAVLYLSCQLAPKDAPIGLIGVSQGGWVVPLAAVRTPAVKFMVLWSGPVVTTLEQLRLQFLTDGRADFWDQHTETAARAHTHSDSDRHVFVATDPADSLRKLFIPGLWLYGGRDVNVPVSSSIERLDSLAAGGHPFEHRYFPQASHQLQGDEALPALLYWLKRTVQVTQIRFPADH